MAADNTRAPLVLVGSGLVWCGTSYQGHIQRWEMSLNFAEVVGRFNGHVTANAFGDKDCMHTFSFDDMRPEMLRYHFNKMAKGYDSITEVPSLTSSATIYNVEPIKLVDSATASTVSYSGATINKVWKQDFSQEYVDSTDYTITSSEITLIGGADIANNQQVYVEYNADEADAVVLELGHGEGPWKGALHVVFVDTNTGYLVEYTHTKCSPVGDSTLAIGRTDEWGGIPSTYRALADLSINAKYGKLVFSATQAGCITGV